MTTISLDEVLARMAEADGKPFRLRFVRATGKNIGSIADKMCYYGAPNPRDRQATPAANAQRAERKTHLESDTIPLTEFESKKMLTPLICHLIGFNGAKIIH